MAMIRRQYELQDLQATMYNRLYYQTTGKKPVGFQWYHLRSGKTFFTLREERDFQNMHECPKHVLNNSNAVSYPKHIGQSCFLCDYILPCREDRLFYISPPEEAPDKALQLQLVPNEGVFDSGVRQGRFRLRVPREKGTSPSIAVGQHVIDVEKSPWRQEELPEEPDFTEIEIYLA